VTDDLTERIARWVAALGHFDWDRFPQYHDEWRGKARELLPIVEAHGRASAATALREAADDWDANTNHVCDAPEELRDAATRLEATP
jgi:hypothetical protein